MEPAPNRASRFHDRLARLAISPFYDALADVASDYGWATERFDERNNVIRLPPGIVRRRPIRRAARR